MQRAVAACLLALAAACVPGQALGEEEARRTGAITVVFHGCESDAGAALVALLDSEEAYDSESRAFREARSEIVSGEARVTFEGVPFGTYALKVIHDENGNGELDTSFVGLPKEAFGFSNDAMGRFGPPDFEAASFELRQPVLVVQVRARRL